MLLYLVCAASSNTRYIDRIEKLVPETKNWYKAFNQTRSDYHGGDFDGPQLRRLMKQDSLNHLRQLLSDQNANSDCMSFYDAMISFVLLKKKTFGM